MIFVDSNVLLDVLDRDHRWFDWSFANLQRAAFGAELVVSAVVVAEVAPRFESLEDFLSFMTGVLIRVEPLGAEGAYLAGEAFRRYRERRRPNQAKSILADFLIGGHAKSLGASILTRDPRFYRSYFEDVSVITPEREDHD